GEDRNGQALGGDYEKALRVENISLPPGIRPGRAGARFELLQGLEREFVAGRPAPAVRSHRSAYERAVKMMRSPASRAFDLDQEPAAVRDAYGRNRFGQGCLLARRLVEHGVPFVEVTLGGAPGAAGGWDTHSNNFEY